MAFVDMMEKGLPLDRLFTMIEMIVKTIENPDTMQNDCTVYNMMQGDCLHERVSDKQFIVNIVAHCVFNTYLLGAEGLTQEEVTEACGDMGVALEEVVNVFPDHLPVLARYLGVTGGDGENPL